MTDSNGADITPLGRKSIGLLALLAETPSMRRGRRWLEDKLWSDRAPRQAQGSLRSALLEIRRCFGPAANALGSDRKHVWLDASAVQTDLTDTAADGEFLEGLDIVDPEFNDWLIHKRVSYAERVTTESDPGHVVLIQCGMPWRIAQGGNPLAQMVDDQIGKTVSGFIAHARRTLRQENPDLIIRTTVDQGDKSAMILAQVIDPATDDLVHSDHCFVSDLHGFLADEQALGRFCWGVADAALERMPQRSRPNSAIAQRSRFVQSALRDTLSFDAASMGRAFDGLGSAYGHLPSGLFLAFGAWVLMSMALEEVRPDTEDLRAEMTDLLNRAEGLSPEEPMVLALSASVRGGLLGDTGGSAHRAGRVLREDPHNLFALLAMSKARAAQGDPKTAWQMSRHASQISAYSKFDAMCSLQHAILCLSMRRPDEAMAAAERAAQCNTNYRAPLRQLLALQAGKGDVKGAMASAGKLALIEPDFTIERFLFDRRYPADTLRDIGYLDAARIGLLDRDRD